MVQFTELSPAALVELVNRGGLIGVLVLDLLVLVTALGRKWVVVGWVHVAMLAWLTAERDKYASLATDATKMAATLAETNKQLAGEVAYLREIVRQQQALRSVAAGGTP